MFGEKLNVISWKKNLDGIQSFDEYGTTLVDLGLLPRQQNQPEVVECAVATVLEDDICEDDMQLEETDVVCGAGELKIRKHKCNDQLIAGMVMWEQWLLPSLSN